MRPSIRLAALMEIRPIYVFTHDSIGLGEDGPTHQPVETLAALRAIPHLVVIRPADATETVEAWKVALRHRGGPVALILSRQKLPVLDRSVFPKAEALARGAYILSEAKGGDPRAVLMATGSEVTLALQAQKLLEGGDSPLPTRVVSFPSWQLFERQPAEYRDQVLPPSLTCRVAVEAGVSMGWERYLGLSGDFVGMKGFGASAPIEDLMKQFGFTAENVARRVRELAGQRSR
jgi:transketolase